MEIQPNYLINPIFILYPPKSGSTLLQSLLDGHPELLVFPVELEYYLWINKSSGKNGVVNKKTFLEFLFNYERIQWLGYSDIPLHHNEDIRDFTNIEFNLFSQLIKNYKWENFTRRECLNNIIDSYHESMININKSGYKAFVTNSTHNIKWYDQIFKDFPNAKILQTVRDPRDNYISYIKTFERRSLLRGIPNKVDSMPTYKQVHGEVVLNKILSFYKLGLKIKRKFPNQHKFIQYENLIQDPQKIMKEIASFIGIKWDDSLLQPTILGNPWKGNSSTNKMFNKVENSSKGRYKKQLNKMQIETIEKLCYSEMKYFNYHLDSVIRYHSIPLLIFKYLRLKKMLKIYINKAIVVLKRIIK